MSASVLAIALMLTAQVGAAKERYPLSGASQAGTTGAAESAAGGQGVQPPPDAGSGTPNSAPPSSDGTPESSAPPPQSDSGFGSLFSGDSDTPPPAEAPPTSYSDLERQLNSSSADAPPNGRGIGLKPSALMRDILKPPRDSQLDGNTVPLIDVVAGATSRAEQAQRIEAYWDLCSSVADYYLRLREQEELHERISSLGQQSGDVWQQAQAELKVRIGTSQRSALASQLRLAEYLGRGAENLPLPADVPHCGSYHTRYEEIFAGRPSIEASELASLLPLRYAELKAVAAAVPQAEEWVDVVAGVDKGDGSGTLRAMELFTLRRRAFVELARDYNRRIARYTELAAPGEIGAERLVGMLIKSEHTSTATRGASPNPPPNYRSGSAAAAPPQTFADGAGWEPASTAAAAERARDDAVRPAAGETTQQPRQERSLLVPRR